MKVVLTLFTLLGALVVQDDFIGDVFENGSVNYGDQMIQAVGIGFIPENVINAGQPDDLLCDRKQDALRQLLKL